MICPHHPSNHRSYSTGKLSAVYAVETRAAIAIGARFCRESQLRPKQELQQEAQRTRRLVGAVAEIYYDDSSA